MIGSLPLSMVFDAPDGFKVPIYELHEIMEDFHVYICIKRLRLGKTTGWQHRFFDLTILSPLWLGTYE